MTQGSEAVDVPAQQLLLPLQLPPDAQSRADAATPEDQTPIPEANDEMQAPGPKRSSFTLNVPNPAVTYGRLNPEIEESVDAVDAILDDGPQKDVAVRRKMPDVNATDNRSAMQANTAEDTDSSVMHSTLSNSNHFLDLPRELLNAVFAYLTPLELVATTLVSRAFYNLANDDIHWQKHVLSNLPARKMSSPTPCRTWRELYIAHDPYWFLPKHKVWFCDRELTGQMVICRYDERRGCIEGYQLLAVRSRDGSEPWLADHNVHIHYFDPQVKLHIDKPILQFNVDSIENRLRNMSTGHPRSTGHFSPEQVIRYSRGSDPRFSNFMLAKPLAESLVNMLSTRDFPYDYVWPPPQIPAKHRVLSQPAGIGGRRPRHMALSPENNATSSPTSLWQPSARSETSDQTFRIRQWMEMGPPALGVRIGEEIVTYSTLDPKLYTPTPEKPWKGIWVGDYSGHGCEFLLMNQPDTEDQDNEAPLRRHVDESDETFQKRFMDERVYRGRLEAIKLTGDPNVPRGEYTFIVEDLGEGGFMGITQEPPFQGTRVVRSKGHIAHAGFFHDKYIESQLILISQNRLAQYWKDFGHISFFERVDIDQFLVPKGPCF